ncbi:hypothetical protein AGMMS50268_40150 [Spirochaetia bacterium]|nr:hypothetical protein AGMMS50268_40150 [Spirochaetia bacterium]
MNNFFDLSRLDGEDAGRGKEIVIYEPKLNPREDVRILMHPYSEGTGLLYNGSIFERIPVHKAYSLLSELYNKETGKNANKDKLKWHFPDLFITQTDMNMSEILTGRDGNAYDFAALRKSIKDSNYKGYESSDFWIKPASFYKDRVPTQQLGAKYLLPKERPCESKIIDFFKERLLNEEDYFSLMTAIVKGFVLNRSSKESIVILSPVKNSGKTVESKVIKNMFGDYAEKINLKIITPNATDTERYKYYYDHKNIRFFIIGETDQAIVLNERTIKDITGREDLPVPFNNREENSFNVNFQLFGGGSNIPFKPEDSRFTLYDRIFYLPFGKVLPLEERVENFEKVLGTDQELDTFFSYLVDNFSAQITTNFMKKTRSMSLAEDYSRLLNETVRFFLDKCCLRGVSTSNSNLQKYTCSQIHTLFLKFIRLYGIFIIKKLRFNYDADGNELNDSQILGLFSFPTEREFKNLMDRELGAATVDSRSNKGYMWKNLFVKAPLIFLFNNENIQDYVNSFDEILASLDRIKTVDDAFNSIKAFNSSMQGGLSDVQLAILLHCQGLI